MLSYQPELNDRNLLAQIESIAQQSDSLNS